MSLTPEELKSLRACRPDFQGKTWQQIANAFAYEDMLVWLSRKESGRGAHFKHRDPEEVAREILRTCRC